MFLKLSFRIFTIGLLVLSTLWVLIVFLPVLYSIVFPPRDIRDIVRALESKSNPPANAVALVERTVASAGILRRSFQVGYYSGVSATLHYNDSHTSRRIQVAYVAWFQKIPAPILLLITRSETDGILDGYQLGNADGVNKVINDSYPFGMPCSLCTRRKAVMRR